MRYLTIFIYGQPIEQKPTTMTDEEAIDLDSMLHRHGLLSDNEELAVVEDVNEEFVDHCKSLVEGVEVDLDAQLSPEEETYDDSKPIENPRKER